MDNTRTADTFSQLSQEKILKIMNMVKNKEVSIEGALHLAQKEVYAGKDPQDLLTGSQFNFIIYKYKHYRWQKRILQLDFSSRTIFNIEKGTIRKQFPFSQVRGCEDSERRRFSILFHGRQHYELEAVSLDDKRKIIYLLSRVIQSNSYKRPAESCPGRVAECDVIHEGLLDLQQNTLTSTEWVKCLAELREGELALYCLGLGGRSPAATIPLAAVSVGESRDSGCSTFSLHTRDHHYLELKDKLFIIHEESGGLTDEQITALRRYLPTPKDAERYLSFKGPCSELHVVDQFMLEMCKIPQLGQRLDLLLSIRELPESIRDLEPLIIQNIQASRQLQSSPKFVAVLEYILAMGNHLNEKAGKEVARGFRLSSLAKLSLLRGRDRTFTLLHALVEQILLHQPELATFPQELTEFEAVPDASMKGLSAEVDVLKKELENLVQCRRLLKPKASKATPQESQFCKELKDLIQKYEGDLSQLSKRCEEMKKLYSNVLVRFGEAADLDSQELFGGISSFICEFRKACAEVTP
ncbi:formin-like protein 13 [Pyrgilauda ruficollis]|uniref:formin-like protein 13 n=1 Tax=Pyrgilauda ruficollis TaxID=221976 RepID=UPI001B874AD3|nr:formin-like protein 13 [Pyrgilauda ruficollis]